MKGMRNYVYIKRRTFARKIWWKERAGVNTRCRVSPCLYANEMKLLLMYYRSVVGRQTCRIISRPFFPAPALLSPLYFANVPLRERERAWACDIRARGWKKSVSDIFHAAKITLTATTRWNVSEGTMKIYRARHRCSTSWSRERIDNFFLVCWGLAGPRACRRPAITR
jgi:hypothetical protein